MSAATESRPSVRSAPDFFSAQVTEARRFYLDLRPAHSRSLAVVCGGVEQSLPDYLVCRDSFPFYSLEYVVSGRGTVRLKGKEHALRAGRVFSYGPGIRHEIRSEPGDPLVKYFVDFTGRRARGLLASCGLAPGRASQVHPPSELQAIFDELIHCGVRGTRNNGVVCQKLLECLFAKLEDAQAPMGGTERLAFGTYQQCRGYIQQHFRRLKTLEQISAECRVNNAYLCRLFRRYEQQSPYQFLLRLRMNRAAELLQQPGALVKQVAEETGFGDPFHFSRAFKSVFGVSPDSFRYRG